jgi:hypothetical protein
VLATASWGFREFALNLGRRPLAVMAAHGRLVCIGGGTNSVWGSGSQIRLVAPHTRRLRSAPFTAVAVSGPGTSAPTPRAGSAGSMTCRPRGSPRMCPSATGAHSDGARRSCCLRRAIDR